MGSKERIKMQNMNNDVKLYVVTNRPYIYLKSDVIFPIATNTELGNSLNTISSDQGENIASYNHLIAEFTSLYWVWKNDLTSKYVGYFHDRRYLLVNETKTSFDRDRESAESCGFSNEDIKEVFKSYDIIIPRPQILGTTVYSQYCICHEQNLIDKFLEILNKKYPEYVKSYIDAFNDNKGNFCNIFIMRREDFDHYMEFIFDIFEDIKASMYFSKQYKPFGYLCERIFIGYVRYLKDVKGYRVKETPVLYILEDKTIIRESTGMEMF